MPTKAPVCNITPLQPFTQPGVPALPAIPIANDLQSGLQAINTMRIILQMLTNQFPNNGGSGPGGSSSIGGQQNPKTANFVEQKGKRVTTKTRVYNPSDHSQYVDVEQITGLTFFDNASGQYINWAQ